MEILFLLLPIAWMGRVILVSSHDIRRSKEIYRENLRRIAAFDFSSTAVPRLLEYPSESGWLFLLATLGLHKWSYRQFYPQGVGDGT